MTLDFSLPANAGVMLCGHGSRNKLAVGEFANLSGTLSQRLSGIPVDYGYLEFADPVITHGLDKLRERGVTKIYALPGMLFAAGHAKNDIPSVLNTYAARHGIEIDYGRELGVDLKNAQRRRRTRRRGRGCRRDRGLPSRHLVDGRRPRGFRSGCQFQRRQDDAHALGGHGLWLGRDVLFRRHLPACRPGSRQGGPSRVQAHHRLSLFPVHRGAGEAHLCGGRCGDRGLSRDRISQSALSQRPSAWSSIPSSTGCAK